MGSALVGLRSGSEGTYVHAWNHVI